MANLRFEPLPPYFLIKIGKQLQKERKEKEGMFYFPEQYAYLKRGCQFGEIVFIGSGAAEFVPQAEVGDYLLHHHFVEGKKTDNGHNFYLVDEDEDFNYYVVNAYEIPGEKALAYAIAKGSEIIPTADYIFLEVPAPDTSEDLMTAEVSKNGLIIPKEKTKTREQWIEIMQKNKKRCELLGNVMPSGAMEEIMLLQDPAKKERHDYAVQEIKMLEAENLRISNLINKKRYEPYVVAAVNPEWSQSHKSIYGDAIKPGDTVYMLNIACQYRLNFSGTEFIVAECKYFGCSDNWAKKSINDSTLHNVTTKKRKSKV